MKRIVFKKHPMSTVFVFIMNMTEYAAQKIKMLREQKGINQAQLAELINTERDTVSKLERNERKLTADRIVDICNALGCTPNELLGFTTMIECKTPDLHTLKIAIIESLGYISTLPKATQDRFTPEYIAEFSLMIYNMIAEQMNARSDYYIGKSMFDVAFRVIEQFMDAGI
jgi:transcriptional regulator with XRE-family HTH domain